MEAVDAMRSCHIPEVEPARLALGRVRCLALATLKLGKTGEKQVGRVQNQQLQGQVKFQMSNTHPYGDSQQTLGHHCRVPGRGQGEDINVGIITIQMLFNGMGLDELIQAQGVLIQKTRAFGKLNPRSLLNYGTRSRRRAGRAVVSEGRTEKGISRRKWSPL